MAPFGYIHVFIYVHFGVLQKTILSQKLVIECPVTEIVSCPTRRAFVHRQKRYCCEIVIAIEINWFVSFWTCCLFFGWGHLGGCLASLNRHRFCVLIRYAHSPTPMILYLRVYMQYVCACSVGGRRPPVVKCCNNPVFTPTTDSHVCVGRSFACGKSVFIDLSLAQLAHSERRGTANCCYRP
jgi:hypothetical protein